MAQDRYDYGGGTADDRTSAYDFDQMAGQHGFFGLASYRDARTMRELRDQIKMMESGLMTPEQAFPEGGPWAEKYERAFGTPFPGMQTVTPSEMDPTTGEMIPGPEQQRYGPLGNERISQAWIRDQIARGTQPGPSEELMAASGMLKSKGATDVLAKNTRNARAALLGDQEANKQYRPIFNSVMGAYPKAPGGADAWAREAQHVIAQNNPRYAETLRRWGVERPTPEELGPKKLDATQAHQSMMAAKKAQDTTDNMMTRLEYAKTAQEAARAWDQQKFAVTSDQKDQEIAIKKNNAITSAKRADAMVFGTYFNAAKKLMGGNTALEVAKYAQAHGGSIMDAPDDLIPDEIKTTMQETLNNGVEAERQGIANTKSLISTREATLSEKESWHLQTGVYNLMRLQQQAELGHGGSKEQMARVSKLMAMSKEARLAGNDRTANSLAEQAYAELGMQGASPKLLDNLMSFMGVGGRGPTITPIAPQSSAAPGVMAPPGVTPTPGEQGIRPGFSPDMAQKYGKALQDFQNLKQALPGKLPTDRLPPPAAAPTPAAPPPAARPAPAPGPLGLRGQPLTPLQQQANESRKKRGLQPLY